MILGTEHVGLFVDCMPSEQGGFDGNDAICIVATAVFGDLTKFKEIKQYKDCSRKQRLLTAGNLISSIEDGSLGLDVRSIVVRKDDADSMGRSIFSVITGLTSRQIDEVDYVTVNGKKLGKKRAFMYASFAVALACLSHHLASVIKYTRCTCGTLILDNLPGDDASSDRTGGMEWIKLITDEIPMLKLMWLESWVQSGKSDLGYSYALVDPMTGYVMADWIAQGLHASINYGSFNANVQKKPEMLRRQVASVFFAYLEKYIKATGSDGKSIIFHLPLATGFDNPNNTKLFQDKIREIQQDIAWQPLSRLHEF